MKKPYLEAGRAVGAHGVRGELRVQPLCDSPVQFAAIRELFLDPEGTRPVKAVSRPHGNIALVKLAGTDTLQAAEALRGRTLYARREDFHLPPGRHFICDLIGCRVLDAATGEEYGVLTDVSFTGSNDVYHMDMGGREMLIPVIPDIVKDMDTDAGVIKIKPMEGLFE